MNKPINVLQLPQRNIIQVPYWQVDEYWPKAAPMIQKALDVQNEWTLDSVYRKLVNSDDPLPMQLWYIPDTGAIITQVQTFPTGVRKCLLFLGGGTAMDESLALHAEIENWARKFRGCHEMVIYGRRGWQKVLKGYTEKTVIMEKKL